MSDSPYYWHLFYPTLPQQEASTSSGSERRAALPPYDYVDIQYPASINPARASNGIQAYLPRPQQEASLNAGGYQYPSNRPQLFYPQHPLSTQRRPIIPGLQVSYAQVPHACLQNSRRSTTLAPAAGEDFPQQSRHIAPLPKRVRVASTPTPAAEQAFLERPSSIHNSHSLPPASPFHGMPVASTSALPATAATTDQDNEAPGTIAVQAPTNLEFTKRKLPKMVSDALVQDNNMLEPGSGLVVLRSEKRTKKDVPKSGRAKRRKVGQGASAPVPSASSVGQDANASGANVQAPAISESGNEQFPETNFALAGGVPNPTQVSHLSAAASASASRLTSTRQDAPAVLDGGDVDGNHEFTFPSGLQPVPYPTPMTTSSSASSSANTPIASVSHSDVVNSLSGVSDIGGSRFDLPALPEAGLVEPSRGSWSKISDAKFAGMMDSFAKPETNPRVPADAGLSSGTSGLGEDSELKGLLDNLANRPEQALGWLL